MSAPAQLLLAYFGDDFTGSTDALESLSRAGARTALFIQPPTPSQLARYAGLQAVGVAGMTRSLAPAPMADELAPAFAAFRALEPRHVHYKVCSTFDSSPDIGSIGQAIDIGRELFPEAPCVPVVVGAPALGRYSIFGNLFARMGIGSAGAIHRLDRHPSASRHPTTPAEEADLRLHLGRQTRKRIGLFDILQLTLPADDARAALRQLLASGDAPEILFFDLLYAEQQAAVGALLDRLAPNGAPLFSVGSSGVGSSLGDHWGQTGQLQPRREWPSAGPVEPLLVLSGSRSPVTAAQIDHAVGAGFAEVALDTATLVRQPEIAMGAALAAAATALAAGRHVVIHTSHGSDDPRHRATAEAFALAGFGPDEARAETGPRFGHALGKIARQLIDQHRLPRLLIAGGDTSSYAARALGIEAVEMLAPLAPGAPLCRTLAPGSPADGIEINFKGGQVGGDGYFPAVARGHL